MAQFARPDSNVTQSSVTGGFAEIDEATASDSDYAWSPNNTLSELEVGLSNVTDPDVHTGHVFRFRYAKVNDGTPDSGGNDGDIECILRQGTTQIATSGLWLVQTGTWTTRTVTLTEVEAAAITDYSDLRLEFIMDGGGGGPSARRGVAVSWAELEVPDFVEPPITLTPDPVATSMGVPASAIGLGALALAPAPVASSLAVPVSTVAIVDPTIWLEPGPVALSLSQAAPGLSQVLALAPTPVGMATSVPSPALATSLALTPSPVALSPAVPVPSVATGAVELSPSAVVLSLSVPSSGVTADVELLPDPVVLSLALTSPTIGLGALALTPDPVALSAAVPAASIGLGALELSPSAVVLVLAVTDSAPDADIWISPDPISLILSSPNPVLNLGSLSLTPSPVPLLTGTPVPGFGLVVDLAPAAVAVSLGVSVPQVVPGTLALQPSPVALQLGLVAVGRVGPLIIVTGSDEALVAEMVAYWDAYDAAGTETERRALLRKWLLDHGAKERKEKNEIVLKGGLRPVRLE